MSRPHGSPALSQWKLAAAAFAGGIMGSVARGGCEWIFVLAGAPAWTSRLAVNVAGAFALGVVFGRLCEPDERGVPLGVPHRNRVREHLWGSGFMGGFTTVSGFAWDVAWALQHGEHLRLGVLLAVDGAAGIAAAAAGYATALRARTRGDTPAGGSAPHP